MARLSTSWLAVLPLALTACFPPGPPGGASGSGMASSTGSGAGGAISTGSGASSGSSGAGGTSGVGGGSASTGSGGGVCVPPGFSPAAYDFPVPGGYGAPGAKPFKLIANQDTAACGAGYDVPMYGLVDLDGDAELDMVITERCNDPDTGASRWLFHRGSPAGFAQSPADFALPGGYSSQTGKPLHVLANQDTAACGAGYDVPAYGLFDLDGDVRPDLVVTDRCNDPATGLSRWLVHAGQKGGLSPAPADVALPAGYFSANAKPFHLLANQDGAACGAGFDVAAYELIDLDGDLLRDLVITDRCGDPSTGQSKWLVHKGVPGGFASVPSDFALPSGYFSPDSKPFRRLRNQVSAACGAGYDVPAYTVLDVDGDDRVDLVFTDRCNDPATGQSRWLFHAGTPSGFAPTPSDFALPGGYSSIDGKPFRLLANQISAACGGGYDAPAYGVLDLDGDKHPDLLVTERCTDLAVGDSKWLLYKGAGTGFGPPVDVALPGGYSSQTGRPFHLLRNQTSAACGAGYDVPMYGLFDIDGDLHRDLVITEACDDPKVGVDRWLVYRGDCAP